ncbi:SGNH/GDSL hydrolase family protein [Magnetovibrio sp. PR-2]|uniref:SGNH/GDSL hydrolase family protein n=1 Tax=Magnetovibrio sp. PR-2 TaxID=3120356 RepID=UPI002FCDFD89
MFNTIKTYVLISFVTLGLVALVDLGIRAYEISKGELFVQRHASFFMKNLSLMKYRQENSSHPFLMYTSVANYKGMLPLIEPGVEFRVSINNHGFRTNEFYPKVPWKTRVVIMGDSFMWGYNANQSETAAAALEDIIHEKLSKDVEVFSLGVSSYSGVRYAALARIYLDFLDPDIVVVALDQSDFGEDLSRFDDYILDDQGYPYVLKDADELLRKKEGEMLALDVWGNMVQDKMDFDLKTRIRMGSPLGEGVFYLADWMRSREDHAVVSASDYIKNSEGQKENATPARGKPISSAKGAVEQFAQKYPNIKITTYDELLEKYGDDITPGLPQYVRRDTIPFTLERAIQEYQPTFKSMEYIRNETLKRNQSFYLASYPYPKMITPYENVEYNVDTNKSDTVFDFSTNRVHPRLMDAYAQKLGISHIDTYPLFEVDSQDMWGHYDPHLTAKGYSLFAQGVYDGIKSDLIKRLKEAEARRPDLDVKQ